MSKLIDLMKESMSKKKLDFPFLFAVIILLAIGLVALSSASSYYALTQNGYSSYYLVRQLGFAVVGVGAMLFIAYSDTKRYNSLSYLVFIGAMVLMVLVFVPGLGVEVKGARRWLNIGIGTFQPSEVLKIGLILATAKYITSHQKEMKSWKGYVWPVIYLALSIVLLYFQSHMSAVIVLVLIFMMVILASGIKLEPKIIIPLVLVAILAFVIFISEDYRWARVVAFFNPEEDITGSNWQPIQSLYAIGSGGLFGRGLGQSRQKYLWLPEAQNDFVFAVYAEEFGFVGSLLVMLLFMFLIYRGVLIGTKAKNMYSMLICIGIMAMFAIQILINIAVVTKTIPTTGMPLPFFSSGGTSLVINLAAMGVVLGVSKENGKG